MQGTPAAPQTGAAATPTEFDPRLWLRKVDPRTRRPYFVHRRTGRTSWDVALRTAADTSAAASPLLFASTSSLFRAAVPVNTGTEPSSSASSLSGAAIFQGGSGAAGGPASAELEKPPSAASSSAPPPLTSTAPNTEPADEMPPPSHTGTTAATQPVLSSAFARTPYHALNPIACSTIVVPHSLETSVTEAGHAPETSPLGAVAASTAAAATPAVRVHGAPHSAASPPSASASPDSPSLRQDSAAGASSNDVSTARTHTAEPAQTHPPSLDAASQSLPHASTAADTSVGSRSLTQTFRAIDSASVLSALTTTTLAPSSSPASAAELAAASQVGLADPLEAPGELREVERPQMQLEDFAAEASSSGVPEDAVAAEEWRLTRRTWDLEEERARVGSELAVLRGPVEVEAQSIGEEHERLLEEQRALQAAATLAVQEQHSKRTHIAALQRRLTEVRQQQRDGAALVKTLHERRDTLRARAAALDAEATQLSDERHRLESVELPTEERQLRACQARLAAARRRIAEQEERLRERQQALERSGVAVHELHCRVDEMAAWDGAARLQHREANQRRAAGVKPVPHAHRSGGASLAPAAVRNDAAASERAVDVAAEEGGRGELRSRLEALQREAAAFDAAARALYETDVMAHQEHALRAATHRVKDLTEVWLPTLMEAEVVVGELCRHTVTQSHKHKGGRTR